MNNIIDTLINEYDKKYDFYLIKKNFKLVFNNPQYVEKIETSLHNGRIIMSSGYLLDEAIIDIIDQGYSFDHIDEFTITTIADKTDMTFDFYIKHKMCAFELKLDLILVKNPYLINSLKRSHDHPIIRKYSYIPF